MQLERKRLDDKFFLKDNLLVVTAHGHALICYTVDPC